MPIVDNDSIMLGIITESDFVRITFEGHECTEDQVEKSDESG